MKAFKKIIFICLCAISPVNLFSQTDNYFETAKNIEIFTSLYKELDMSYVDEINSGDLMKKAIDKMLKSLDPYTVYIPESEIEDFRFMTTGKYGGIGAIISQRDDYVIINEPYEGSPAEKSGLIAGDKILEVNGRSAKGKTTEELSKILKGQPNTEVRLLIERGGDAFRVKFKREKITVKSIPYYGLLEGEIGYIKLRSFTMNCSNEVKNAVKELKAKTNLKGIILDLRSNPGGLLNESINLVNIFIEKGEEVVRTKGKTKDWEKIYKCKNNAEDLTIPLVVLINQSSASASEIVSGAVQDLDRGVIIGSRSYGKGLVQQTKQLSYNTKLKVTVAKYYIPSGRCIQALDYSNRNNDGSVGKIPDSLISVFKTRNGREVKDGGGISPDIIIDRTPLSDISISLLRENLIFDYATEFNLNNESILNPEKFRVTEEMFFSFQDFLSDKNYEYTTASEEALELFKEISEEDNTFSIISEEYKILSNKIQKNKENDLKTHQQEIKRILSEEIVSRYYYQEGRIRAKLIKDDAVREAIEILGDLERYRDILNKSNE